MRESPNPAATADIAYEPDEHHPLVEAFVRDFLPDGVEPDLTIAEGDEMWGFAVNEQYQHRGMALIAYLRSGYIAFETLSQVLAWRFGETGGPDSMLDMASGFGRVTRYLTSLVPPERLTIAEINPQAVSFQRERFGVDALLSSVEPDEFPCERRFSCVSALSLFTHLPRARFERWLAALWERVEPGGVLVFSTNGPEILPPGEVMPEDGFRFERVSEIAGLSLEDYGSTWMTEELVRRVVATSCPDASSCSFVVGGLWSCQDLVVVTRGTTPTAPLEIVREPVGFLDNAWLSSAREVALSGWAIDRDRPGRPVDIELWIDGECLERCRTRYPRPDLVERLGEEYEKAGWLQRVRAPIRDGGAATPFRPTAPLMVVMEAASGRRGLLHLSALEGADLRSRAAGGLEEIRLQNLGMRNVVQGLELKIRAMEKSRFWKLRNAWFVVRRAIGLGD